MAQEKKRPKDSVDGFVFIGIIVWCITFYVEFFIPESRVDSGYRLPILVFLVVWWPIAIWLLCAERMHLMKERLTDEDDRKDNQ